MSKQSQTVIRNFTRPELDRMVNSLNGTFGPRNRALIRFGIATGLRVSELVALNIGDVSRNGRPVKELHVRAETAKRGKPRTIPLSEDARAAVRELLKFNKARGYPTGPDAALFVSRKPNSAGEHRLTRFQVARIVRETRKKLGLTFRATPHSLRHTAATRIYEASGGDLILAKEFLGHASVRTTEIYAHANREKMQNAVEKM